MLKRFEAYGWHTLEVKNGNGETKDDLLAMENAIAEAKKVTNRPSVIKLTTTIGFGSKAAGTGGVHGSALKPDDAKQVKQKFGFDPDKSFVVPQEVYDLYHKTSTNGATAQESWQRLLERYRKEYPTQAADLERRISGKLPEGWEKALPTYTDYCLYVHRIY